MVQEINKVTGQGRIFVLGDSRTGTTTLHNFFARNHIPSKHYFMTEAGQTDPIHVDHVGNRLRFFEYLEAADVAAFSDYPTRYFFRELHEGQPDASFILTVRSSTQAWRGSLEAYLGKFGIKADFDALCSGYEMLNQEIEALYSKDRRFLKITIDDGEDNSRRIADFLGWKTYLPLTRDNASGDIDNRIWSKRHTMYGGEGLEALKAIQWQYHDAKAIISEFGWSYLINDTNWFLEHQFGARGWGKEQREKARSVLAQRVEMLDALGVRYLKFIVPEKSVIYPEYLPKGLAGLSTAATRPATELEASFPDHVFYLGDSVRDAKSYGQLYFRGDTQTNWMGAWVVYRQIVDAISLVSPLARQAISYNELVPSIASHDGDLATQLPDTVVQEWRRRWAFTGAAGFFEDATKLSLRVPEAKQVNVPADLMRRFPKRHPLLYERTDGQGARAVIFRDSTADFLCDYLAEHFSRALFIWKDGQVFEDIVKEERPDIVLHIMAERFVSQYPEFTPLA